MNEINKCEPWQAGLDLMMEKFLDSEVEKGVYIRTLLNNGDNYEIDENFEHDIYFSFYRFKLVPENSKYQIYRMANRNIHKLTSGNSHLCYGVYGHNHPYLKDLHIEEQYEVFLDKLFREYRLYPERLLKKEDEVFSSEVTK